MGNQSWPYRSPILAGRRPAGRQRGRSNPRMRETFILARHLQLPHVAAESCRNFDRHGLRNQLRSLDPDRCLAVHRDGEALGALQSLPEDIGDMYDPGRRMASKITAVVPVEIKDEMPSVSRRGADLGMQVSDVVVRAYGFVVRGQRLQEAAHELRLHGNVAIVKEQHHWPVRMRGPLLRMERTVVTGLRLR